MSYPKINGRRLREQVESCMDVLVEVKAFLKQENELSEDVSEFIDKLTDGLNDLFHLIPLGP